MVMSHQMFINCNFVANLSHYNKEDFFFPQECLNSDSLINVLSFIAKIVINRFLQKRKVCQSLQSTSSAMRPCII